MVLLTSQGAVWPEPGQKQISDHQQSWGYEDGPLKRPGPPLLVAADLVPIYSNPIMFA
jgi:hypothetical protein